MMPVKSSGIGRAEEPSTGRQARISEVVLRARIEAEFGLTVQIGQHSGLVKTTSQHRHYPDNATCHTMRNRG